ncbi:MAG: polysaccharide biosynthesis C-terminal domain-containing protein [Oscillospiraceae bacterium]|nr:polysaccharide biosynthesis C-terminal domain-containing protein [Oscillospiraceae bacterium]
MKKQNFLQSSLILIASAALAKVIGAIFRIPLANMLGGTGMGYFSSAYGIFMTVYAVSATGIPVAAAKLTAEKSALQNGSELKDVKCTALTVCAVTGLAFTLLMLMLAYPFCCFISRSPESVFAVAMIAPSVFFGCVTAAYRGYREGLRNMYPTAVSQVAEAVVKLVSGLACCAAVLKLTPVQLEQAAAVLGKIFPFKELSRLSAEELVMPLAAAAAISGVTFSTFAGMVCVMICEKASADPFKHAKGRFSSAISRQLAKIILPVAAGALISNLTSLIDLATITRSLEKAVQTAPGLFAEYTGSGIKAELLPNFFYGSFTGLAVTIFNLIPSFTNMFGKSAVPSIAGACAEGNADAVRNAVKNVVFTAAYISVPCGIGISAIAPDILRLLFPMRSTETEICGPSLRILGIGVIFLSVSSVLFAALQAVGRSDVPVKIMLWGVAVKLMGNILLVSVPELNVAGAAASTVLCYGVIMIAAIAYAEKYTGLKKTSVFSLLGKIVFCGILCGGTALIVNNLLTNVDDSRISVAVSVISGAIIYIISTHLTGVLNKTTLKMLIC